MLEKNKEQIDAMNQQMEQVQEEISDGEEEEQKVEDFDAYAL